MLLRKYKTSDCNEIGQLFYNTVHTVNAKDYTCKQLDVWASKKINVNQWDSVLRSHHCYVACIDDVIVGFGDIDDTGYLNHLYVHANYQRQGIATVLCNQLETIVDCTITTHASITARPFFEKRGYHVKREQQVLRDGISLVNYIMVKIK